MKKTSILFILFYLIFINCFSQYKQLKNRELNLYNKTSTLNKLHSTFILSSCGLNYVKASVVLGKKMVPDGYPFPGVDQPAQLLINGIPIAAKIKRAYVWWDLSGKDSTGSVSIQNPNLITRKFEGVLLEKSSNKCWGHQAAFRADVTEIISGKSKTPVGRTIDARRVTYLSYRSQSGNAG